MIRRFINWLLRRKPKVIIVPAHIGDVLNKVRDDTLIYGTGYAKIEDGKIEHVPIEEMKE